MAFKFYSVLFVFLASFVFSGITNAQTNVALNVAAYSSSNESGSYLPENAVDGSLSSRWASSAADNQWIYVDLWGKYDLTEVKLFWEDAFGKDFNIEVSDDGVDWDAAAVVTDNTLKENTIDVTGKSGRYVRMYGLTRATNWGFSLWEFEVYGTPSDDIPNVNLAYNKVGSSSSNENENYIPAHAFDGLGTIIDNNGKSRDGEGVEYPRWASEYSTDPQWIAVDLGAKYEINEVRLFWEAANGKDFDIVVSDDGITWDTVASIRDNPINEYVNHIPFSPSVSGRYVQMYGITHYLGYGFSLYEFQVLGPNAILPIKLNNFKVAKKDKTVQLSWEASMDAESRFNIQRSGDGKIFSTIGTLHFPKGTNGNANHYSFTDELPLAGTSFYRLEYTETGERTLYSEALSVRFADERTFVISPNPVSGNIIHVALEGSRQNNLTLRLLSVTGKVIDQQKINASGKTIQMKLNRGLSAGTYILQVLEKNQVVRSRQIVISR